MEQTDFHRMTSHDALAAGSTKWVLARPGESYIAYTYDRWGPMGLRKCRAPTTFSGFDTQTGTQVEQQAASSYPARSPGQTCEPRQRNRVVSETHRRPSPATARPYPTAAWTVSVIEGGRFAGLAEPCARIPSAESQRCFSLTTSTQPESWGNAPGVARAFQRVEGTNSRISRAGKRMPPRTNRPKR